MPNLTYDEKLEELRACQDENDAEFIMACRRSIEITKAVFYLKAAHNVPVIDEKRELAVLDVPHPMKGMMKSLLTLRKTEALLYVSSNSKDDMETLVNQRQMYPSVCLEGPSGR